MNAASYQPFVLIAHQASLKQHGVGMADQGKKSQSLMNQSFQSNPLNLKLSAKSPDQNPKQVSLKLPAQVASLVRNFELWAAQHSHKLQVNRRNGQFVMKVVGKDVIAKLIIREV